jgi:EmrB/QacA subfamily drug resistance transporter
MHGCVRMSGGALVRPVTSTDFVAQKGLYDMTASTSSAEKADSVRYKALAVILLAQLMVVLDASIVTVAVPSAQASLDISIADRQWIFTAYTLAFGSLLLLGGRIADYVGRKRIFEIGLVGFAAASILGGLAQNSGMLFGARALQGAFAALLAPAALSLIQVTFTDTKERAKALGLYGAILGSAMSIGLIAGGMLTEWASWRWTMLVNVPIAVVALIGSRLVVRESRAVGDAHYDVAGTISVTAGLVSLVYGFTKAQSDGWGSGTTLSLLGAGALLLVAFFVIEARSAFPLLPLRLLTDRTRGGTLLAMFLTIAALFSTFLLLTFYLQGILGYSALETGIAYLPYSVGTFIGARIAGTIISRVGPMRLMVTGMLLGAVGLVLFAQVGVDSSFVTHILPAEIVTSLGLGLSLVALTSTALRGVGPADAGVAGALVNTVQQIGSSLGIAVMNTIAATATVNYITDHGAGAGVKAEGMVHGFTVAFLVAAAILVVSALIALLLVRVRPDNVVVRTDESLIDLS